MVIQDREISQNPFLLTRQIMIPAMVRNQDVSSDGRQCLVQDDIYGSCCKDILDAP